MLSWSRFSRAAALALLAALPLGCGSEPASQTDDVTDIKNTSVKNQSIGNCWIYASVGWAESLHLTHTGEQLDFSESYISYWHWFEQITQGAAGETTIARMDPGKSEITTGGWFGLAVELMRRYGVVREGTFIPEEAEAARSSRQSSALSAINQSLKTGALMEASARRDPAKVRAELDKAWGLSPEVSALLDEVFGADVSRSLYDPSVRLPENRGLARVSDIEVGVRPDGLPLTLADAIGEPASSYNVLQRKGEFAWTEVNYPSGESARREFLRRAQKAMHAGQPVIMTWFVDFNAMDNATSAFKAPPATPGRQGGHMTVLEDYEIENVPGYGTLEAGTVVTDEKALEAALADEAQIKFFRIKNSWGSSLSPETGADEFRGYHDLYMEYLNGPLTRCIEEGTDKCARKVDEVPLTALVLPPANFGTSGKGTAGSCGDACSEGEARAASCGTCEAKVCEADSYCCDAGQGSWDAQCVREATELCALACE